MFLTLILVAIIILMIVALFVSRSIMQHRLDTEVYSKNQLVSKVNTLRSEVTSLRNEMINDNNHQQHHYGIRKAKQALTDILEKFKEEGKINFFTIFSTGNLAVKHPLFEQLRTFDYIVITDKGLLNIDVKNWKEKLLSFQCRSGKRNKTESESLDQIIGHYIADQYQSQFQSSRRDVYTFTEKIKNNRVEFDFYDYDPYLAAAVNSKELKDAYEKTLIRKLPV